MNSSAFIVPVPNPQETFDESAIVCYQPVAHTERIQRALLFASTANNLTQAIRYVIQQLLLSE